MDTLRKSKACIVEYAPDLKSFPNPTPTLTDFPNPPLRVTVLTHTAVLSSGTYLKKQNSRDLGGKRPTCLPLQYQGAERLKPDSRL